MKKTITESQLRQIVKESVRKVLRESEKFQFRPLVEDDIQTINDIALRWEYAPYKPDEMDAIIEKLYDVSNDLEDLLQR